MKTPPSQTTFATSMKWSGIAMAKKWQTDQFKAWKRPLCERSNASLLSSAKSSVCTLITLERSMANNKKRSGAITDP